MRIAINAADLDHARIDGTRIYIWNLLKKFGSLDKESQFLIYHKNEFNPKLRFPVYENYRVMKLPFSFWWTQTRFAWEIMREKPEILWMPMHALPALRSRKTKTVITIHDLAFKIFPDHFTEKDLRRLNFFTDYAAKNSDKIIAVSEATKKDLLKFYPQINAQKIKVIYHGYDSELFSTIRDEAGIENVLTKYNLEMSKYFIAVGAIQPRKNLQVLLEAYKKIKKEKDFSGYKLVIAGSPAWKSEHIVKKLKGEKGVVITGIFETEDLPGLLKGSCCFVMASLYEGFGLPLLEAMACGVPVVAAESPGITEILDGSGALFEPINSDKLAEILRELAKNDKMKNALKKKGLERAKFFSWEKCASETLGWLKG